MIVMSTKQVYKPGVRVRVTQTLPRPLGGLPSTVVEGTVVAYEQQPTGSWYAHGKNDKLWLDRLILRRDDGEVVYLNLDQYSQVDAVN
jgi:hypothetical protein